MFTQIAQQIATVPDSVWVIIGGVLGLSALQQAIKHKVDGLSERTNTLMSVSFAALLASSDYLTSAAAQNPTVLGPETAAILGVMTVTYRYIVKPFYNLLIDAQELRQKRTADRQAELAGAAADLGLSKSAAPVPPAAFVATDEFPG